MSLDPEGELFETAYGEVVDRIRPEMPDESPVDLDAHAELIARIVVTSYLARAIRARQRNRRAVPSDTNGTINGREGRNREG
jgi:hypothetical protein